MHIFIFSNIILCWKLCCLLTSAYAVRILWSPPPANVYVDLYQWPLLICKQIICCVLIYESRWIMRQRIAKIGNIGELLNAMSNNCINIHYKSCYCLDAPLIAFFLRTVKFLLLWKNFPFGTAKIRNMLTTT